jgi:hypothetical protein
MRVLSEDGALNGGGTYQRIAMLSLRRSEPPPKHADARIAKDFLAPSERA